MNQLPRSALIWLLVSVIAALLPHATHLPWGFAVFTSLAIGWRVLMHQGRLPYPGKYTKSIAVILACAGIAVAFQSQFSLESAVAFFVATSLLKVLEMKARRDGYVVVFLSYFLVAGGFLFEQGLLQGLYGILAIWLITATLVALQLVDTGDKTLGIASRYSLIMLTAALPLMLVFYLFFPRVSPLWNFSLQSNKALTGLSGKMSPGDIASLSRSDELAFRVTYDDGQEPKRTDLYFRGVVLDRYDGRTWRFSKNDRSVAWFPFAHKPDPSTQSARYYEIIQEPTGQHWLFTLEHGTALEKNIGLTTTGLLVNRRPVHQRKRYRGVSDPYNPILGSLSRAQRVHNVSLPRETNPRIQRWAAEQYAQSGGDTLEFVTQLLAHFNQQPFFYTLNPPELGENDIDAFFFDTQKGFCAHYASAFVFMARSVGIPARVVAGYQGGEWNPAEQYLTVRQFDAHAWVEVWVDNKGWARVDPTAAVAPERIEFGLEEALKEEQSFLEGNLLSPHRFRGVNWLNDLRLKFDSLNYLWHRWVLSYDKQRQRSTLSHWLNGADYKDMLMWLAGSVVGLFLVMSILLLLKRPRNPASPLLRQWRKLQAAAEPLQLGDSEGETSRAWLVRLAERLPELKQPLMQLADAMDEWLYQSDESDLDNQKALLKRINRLSQHVKRAARRKASRQYDHQAV